MQGLLSLEVFQGGLCVALLRLLNLGNPAQEPPATEIVSGFLGGP